MIKLYIANLGKYNEGFLVGEWISLPFSQEEFDNLLERIEIGEQYEEYAIHDYETDIEGLKIGEYDDIDELNDLAESIDNLNKQEFKTLESIIEWQYYGTGINAISEAIDNLDNFDLLEDVNNDYDLGYYWVEESGCYDLSAMGNLANYIDYEMFGRDVRLEGEYYDSKNGYIEYRG